MAVKAGDEPNDSETNEYDCSIDVKEDPATSEECLKTGKVTNKGIETLCNKGGSYICSFNDERSLEVYNTDSGASVKCLNASEENSREEFSKENAVLKDIKSVYMNKNQTNQTAVDTVKSEQYEVDVQSKQETEKNSDEKLNSESEPESKEYVIPENKKYLWKSMEIFTDLQENRYTQIRALIKGSVNRKTLPNNASQPVFLPRKCHGDFTTCVVVFCSMVANLEILQHLLVLLLMMQITMFVNAGILFCLSPKGKQKTPIYKHSVKKGLEWLTTHHMEFTRPSFMTVIKAYPLGTDLRLFMSVTGKTLEKMMENEWIRLSTFVGFPPECPVSTMRLSDAGFYYPGSGNDEVACFKCGVKYKGWKHEDVPVLVHKTISPSCLFIQDKSPPTGDEYGPRPQNIQQRRENRIPVTGSGPQEPGNVGGARGGPSDTQQITSKVSEVNLHSTATSKTENEKEISRPVLAGSQPPDTSQKSNVSNSANFALAPQNSAKASSSSSAIQNLSAGNIETSALPTNGSFSQESGGSTASTAIPPAVEPLGVTTIKPKYPNFAVYVNRLQTFKGFPKDLNQKPEDLAKAGFFYEGKNDNVRCFYCGGGLRDWEPEDDVWIEHARWYQKCVYVRQSKGDEFIRLVHSGQYEILKKERELKKAADQKKKEVMQLPAVVSVIEMGYHENLVKQAYQKCAAEHGDGNVSAEVLIQMVWQLEEEGQTNLVGEDETSASNENEASGAVSQPQATALDLAPSETGEQANTESVEDLEEENRILKEQQMCKICMEEEAAIVFLPCGHMVTCVACAAAMRHCPICRTFIRGTIKAIVC